MPADALGLRFQSALEALYGLERSRDATGLEGTRRLLDALDRPQARFRSIHVAGTNGKGSVSALIERVLRAAGVVTGLFTSPHLVDFRERIRIRGRWADIERLERRLEQIGSLPAPRKPTFFEAATALGFDAFAAAGVEWAVVEVGLGGRLDCTNVLEPAVAAITGIGLDHTEILGATREAVAREKAGIGKPGVPLVTAVEDPGPAGAIAAVAAERGATPVPAGERVRIGRSRIGPTGTRFRAEVEPWGALDLRIGLLGRHQLVNARTALAVLSVLARDEPRLTATALREGFASARWPGRLEPCPAEPRLWWDGAHNPDGVEELARAWSEDLGFEPPETLALAVARDKDARAMLARLAAFAPRPRLVVTRTRSERAMPAETLAALAADAGWRAEVAPDVSAAIHRALAGSGSGRALLLGSLFAVGEAMEAMGGAPGETM